MARQQGSSRQMTSPLPGSAGQTGFQDPFAAPQTVPDGEMPRLSASAAARVAVLARQDGKPGLMLRLTVSGGGCSGFQCDFSRDDYSGPEDVLSERVGVRLVTDAASLPCLAGAEEDYTEGPGGSYFRVHNPNASASCGCGTSFSV